MTSKFDLSTVTTLRDTSRTLREQAMFAHKLAGNNAARTRKAVDDLAELDIAKIFRQVRQMVEIVGGKPAARPMELTASNVNDYVMAAE